MGVTVKGPPRANLAGKVDVAAETQRLRQSLRRTIKSWRCYNKLGNARFVGAPEAVVTEERRRLAEFERRRDEPRRRISGSLSWRAAP